MIRKCIFFCAVAVLLLLAACASQTPADPAAASVTSVRAVYLVPESGGVLSSEALAGCPDVLAVHSLDALKEAVGDGIAIWIDKDAVDMADSQWLHAPPQDTLPLAIVGYNEELFAFTQVLTGFPIDMPDGFDWSRLMPGPGFCVWRQWDDGEDAVYHAQGYDKDPVPEDILAVTDALMDMACPHDPADPAP